MFTVICWGIVTLAAICTVSGVVLDALGIRDDGRLCSPLARLTAIWNAPR
jgi:hypothetical protein